MSLTKPLQKMKWTIKLKRAYDPAESEDGLRILVDRMWPRGIKKTDLKCDIWAKDVTPSTEARHFFHEDPEGHWETFAERYRKELKGTAYPALQQLAAQIRDSGQTTITLVYGFRNPIKNHALVLKEEVENALA